MPRFIVTKQSLFIRKTLFYRESPRHPRARARNATARVMLLDAIIPRIGRKNWRFSLQRRPGFNVAPRCYYRERSVIFSTCALGSLTIREFQSRSSINCCRADFFIYSFYFFLDFYTAEDLLRYKSVYKFS